MTSNKNIFGFFFSVGFDPHLSENEFQEIANVFRPYIWSEKGISDTLKKLKHEDYGKDLVLVLFQFNVKPTQTELQNLKTIEPYRKNERSIGIPIIITDENFFSKTEEERYSFLKQSIFEKLELLTEVVKKRKLDTKIDLLISDLRKVWDG